MGWLIRWADRRSLVKHLCEDNGVKTVKRFFSGNDMWTVQETPTGDRFICLYKMVGGRNQEWGYKDIDESMGPYEDTCPLSFFDMVPVPTYGHAVEFRERCKAAHARKNLKLVKGDVVLLSNGETYTVSESGRKVRGYNSQGHMYRIPRRMLVKVVKVNQEAHDARTI